MQFFQALSDQRTSSDGATLHPSPLRKDKTVTPGMSTKPRGDGRRTDGRRPLPPLGAAGAALQCDTDKVAVISRSAEKENNSRREFRANQGRRAAGRRRARGGRMWALGGEAETEICAGDRPAHPETPSRIIFCTKRGIPDLVLQQCSACLMRISNTA